MNIQVDPPPLNPRDRSRRDEMNQKLLFFDSLKFKGYLFIVFLVSYIAFLSLFVLSQRNQPLEQLEQYQKIQKAQEALVQADLAAFHIVTILFSNVSQNEFSSVVGYFSGLREQYINLQRWFPEQAESFRMLVETIPESLEKPSQDGLRRVLFHLAQAKTELDRLTKLNRQRLEMLINDYRQHNDSIVVNTLTLGILGLIFIGGVTSLFFSQLKNDLNSLQKRTSEIVQGYRGQGLPVLRKDEVGQLTEGINYMASALAERENALEIERSKASFKDKMVAIDSLAGGIAHEIGNPVTCIAGLAEAIHVEEENLSEEGRENITSLVEYSSGLVRLTRELSVFDTYKGDEFEWVDINQTVSNVCNLFHYDKRWNQIPIEQEPGYNMPAIEASVNQVSQMISNVLENALDAVQNTHNPLVTISTSNCEGYGVPAIRIVVSDNGPGIEPSVLGKIFEPFFSTKPVGQGTGLGLAICWSIAKSHHGELTASSAVNEGTTITITLPVSQQAGEIDSV